MKQKIIIEQAGNVLFKGKIMNIPVKQEKIIEKSIELFDDDSPCIIHTSFIIKHYAEIIIELLNQSKEGKIEVKKHQDTLNFLNYENLDTITIALK